VVGFPAGESLDGRHTLAVTGAFKAAILERLGKPRSTDPWAAFGEDELSLIHGHHDKTARQCAVVALPFVGASHATGELLGIGFCPSRDLDPHLRSALLRLLGLDREDAQPRLHRLRIPGLKTRVDLVAPDGRWSLTPGRWQGPARRWWSALPVVLDWWPRRSQPAEEIIARGCQVAGLPRPSSVELLPASAVEGTPLLRQMDTVRRPGDPRRPLAHIALTFPTKVTGPVIVGHLRHLGLGLCVPDRDRS
jgi:CRISPR-associated protein Csb2